MVERRLKSPLDDLLSSPIPLPDLDQTRSQTAVEIALLERRKLAYNRLSSINLMSQWVDMRSALIEIRDQYSARLVHAKGRGIVEAQEAVKAYDFLIEMPDRANAAIEEIDRAINRLRDFMGIDGQEEST